MSKEKTTKKITINLEDLKEIEPTGEVNSGNLDDESVQLDEINIDLSDLSSEEVSRIVISNQEVTFPEAEKKSLICPNCGAKTDDTSVLQKEQNQTAVQIQPPLAQTIRAHRRVRKFKPAYLIPVILLVMLLISGGYLFLNLFFKGSVITVPNDYPSIQMAIDAAVDGDEIVVLAETYNENIDYLGKAIVIRSEDPSDPAIVAATIINGREAGPVVSFKSGESDQAVLKGFTITGGSGSVFEMEIYEDDGIILSQEFYGGGILVWNDSSPTIMENYIVGNVVEGYGGGIVIWHNSTPLLINNTITGNIALIGGGIAVGGQSSPVIEENNLIFNKAVYSGGAMAVINIDSDPLIKNNHLIDNISEGEGGGISVVNGAAPSIKGNELINNMALRSLGGGGIFVHQASPFIDNNIFRGNISDGEGGGIAVHWGSYPVLSKNAFNFNKALQGGGIWVSNDSEIQVNKPDDNSFADNYPEDSFGQD